jgi:hypothetical protein
LEATDVEAHKEELFNAVYEAERLPALARVPRVRNVVRFSAKEDGHPAYVTLYELDGEDVPTTAAFADAHGQGRWRSEILPYTYNRHLAVYERIDK